MRGLKTITLAAFVVAASAAFSNNITHFVDPATNLTIKHFNCGVSRASASKHFNETIRFLARNTRHSAIGTLNGIGTRAPAVQKRQKVTPALVINTYIHLLTTTAKTGTLTKKQASAQVAALNRAYKPIGVTFNLKNVSITANNAWAVAEGTDMDAVKEALRAGSYADLNLYFHSDLTGGILGTCTLPSQVTAGTSRSQYASDGCNINANTMPGGSLTGYNQGATAAHETGHWLGLLHTFEGYSCTGEGDSIADTPMQSTSTDGCPSTPVKDSCPSADGVDVSTNRGPVKLKIADSLRGESTTRPIDRQLEAQNSAVSWRGKSSVERRLLGRIVDIVDRLLPLPPHKAIHNYMDYSSDSCYSNFTPGQVSRISTLWTQYRKGF